MDENLIAGLIISILSGSVGTVWIILLIFFFPEKIDKWRGVMWGWIEDIGLLYRKANKEKIKYSVQGSISEFARDLSYELPQFNPPGIKIDWVDGVESKRAFIEDGKAVIRLRRSDRKSENIVNASLLFVSQVLLKRSVRYLTPTQKESVQLYVGYKMLEKQPEEVFDAFVDKWLFPGIETGNEKIGKYFEMFKKIDQSQFFLPIFLQELVYMGDKVFGRKRDGSVAKEVDGALGFLDLHASGKIGEKLDEAYYNGDACRFAIMIVGWSRNIDDYNDPQKLDHRLR